jgi:hypothetical protein
MPPTKLFQAMRAERQAAAGQPPPSAIKQTLSKVCFPFYDMYCWMSRNGVDGVGAVQGIAVLLGKVLTTHLHAIVMHTWPPVPALCAEWS